MSSKLQQMFRLRSAAIVLSLVGLAVLPACAQEQALPSQPIAQQGAAAQNLALFSSSLAITSAADDAIANEPSLGKHFGPNPSADPQYGGPRRRPYGRPTYKDRNSNPDGSNKYTAMFGAGFTAPAGDTAHYQTPSYNLSFGAGRNFNRVFAVLMQYDYANMGVPSYISNSLSTNLQLNGSTHLWSITVSPMITFADPHSHYGAYIVAGGGFYRKLTTFTTPVTTFGCDNFGDCGAFTSNEVVGHWSNNAGGLNGGFGFFYKFSDSSSARVFAEARYTWVDNQKSPNNTTGNGYPPANYRTDFIPVTFGVRF